MASAAGSSLFSRMSDDRGPWVGKSPLLSPSGLRVGLGSETGDSPLEIECGLAVQDRLLGRMEQNSQLSAGQMGVRLNETPRRGAMQQRSGGLKAVSDL